MRLQLMSLILGAVALLGSASDMHAQNFFGGNNTAFDPEISIVESGVNLDVQATVSHDRKYVTMTMRPQLATLIALREFVFQGPGGIVGQNGNNPNSNPGVAAKGPRMPALARPAAAKSVLLQEGFYRVDTDLPQPVGSRDGVAKPNVPQSR